ncbi:MAG: CoB--CoM heterodisulfide reductase iron-sulfur subunit B family protein [Hyphomicrobiales bacterium]
MPDNKIFDFSYFPGCSLATTAKENNQSLIECCRKMGINLIELPDWNCCGSSSAHSINQQLAFDLASRNLSLAPPGRPLVAACPSCTLKLKHAQHRLRHDAAARDRYRQLWGRPFDPDLRIRHFFGPLAEVDLGHLLSVNGHLQIDLAFAPYYGCMLNRPYELRAGTNYYGILEKTLAQIGLKPVQWAYGSQCCGTFLTVARPDIVTPKVNAIMQGAAESGAECIVTACAMCHMNLEVRCTLKRPIPIFHFSEILSLAFGAPNHDEWFSRHLIDPRPLLKSKGLTA